MVRTAAAALVINPPTGLALSGFDPVAYFSDSSRPSGVRTYSNGAVCGFRNEGNCAAFKPARPAFGGYDPVAIARGRAIPRHPLIWRIVEERLYLFHSADNRAEFLAVSVRVLNAAERQVAGRRARRSGAKPIAL